MDEQIDITEGPEDNEADHETSTGGVGSALRMALRERPRKESITRKLRERSEELRFLNDFDPEKSEREKRKSKRKDTGSKTAPYDEYGYLKYNGADVCDCMNDDCPGCWFDCEKCGSSKCGPHCRVNRKFFYENISFDGKDMTIMNPHITAKH